MLPRPPPPPPPQRNPEVVVNPLTRPPPPPPPPPLPITYKVNLEMVDLESNTNCVTTLDAKDISQAIVRNIVKKDQRRSAPVVEKPLDDHPGCLASFCRGTVTHSCCCLMPGIGCACKKGRKRYTITLVVLLIAAACAFAWLMKPRNVSVAFPVDMFVDSLKEDMDCGLSLDGTSDCGISWQISSNSWDFHTEFPITVTNENYLVGLHGDVEADLFYPSKSGIKVAVLKEDDVDIPARSAITTWFGFKDKNLDAPGILDGLKMNYQMNTDCGLCAFKLRREDCTGSSAFSINVRVTLDEEEYGEAIRDFVGEIHIDDKVVRVPCKYLWPYPHIL
jgi:hypothetical protein